MIPAITTGMTDFMIRSGRITLIAAIPTPLLAVPYAAPRAGGKRGRERETEHTWYEGICIEGKRGRFKVAS